MTETETEMPPRYVFALFGRRRSGKSVFMAALRALRRPQIQGVKISYVGALPPILADGTESGDEAERKRIEIAYVAASDALSMGKVPPQTNTSDGIMGHRFEITLPEPQTPRASARMHVDIYDYAGELLALETGAQEAIETLGQILRETDGLLILAETPAPNSDMDRHRESLAGVMALGDALSRFSNQGKAAPIGGNLMKHAAFLATKWDRQHPFTCKRAEQEPVAEYLQRLTVEESHHAGWFADWLTTDPAAEQHYALKERLRSLFGTDEYRVWPVSAFGEAVLADAATDDGIKPEVPARIPLASLNLDEPLLFLIERTRARRRREFMDMAAMPDERIDAVPGKASLVAEHGEDAELLALREDLIARKARWIEDKAVEQAAATSAAKAAAKVAARARNLRYLRWGALAVAVVTAGAISWEARTTLRFEEQVRTTAKAALDSKDMETVIAARTGLFDLVWHKPLLPTVTLLGLGYDPQDRATDQAELTALECTLWGDRVRIPNFPAETARTRLETLPACDALRNAIADADAQKWLDTVRKSMDLFRRMTSDANCSGPDFAQIALTDRRNELLVLLDGAPTELVDEAEEAREEIDKQESACKNATEKAADGRRLVEERNTRDSELKKLDLVRDGRNWQAYVAGLAGFADKKGGTSDEDLKAREDGVIERLGLLVGELEDWRKQLIAERQQGQSFMPNRNDQLAKLKIAISALPAMFAEPKDALLDKVAAIEEDFAIWGACTRFNTEVAPIYEEISGNVASRTMARLKDLDNALRLLRDDASIRDHVGDALDQIALEKLKIGQVTVSSVELSGTFPGGSDAAIELKWQFGERSGGPSPNSVKRQDGGNFDLRISPNATLDTADKDMFVYIYQDRIWPAGNTYFAMKTKMNKDDLLSATGGPDPLKATRTKTETLKQFDHQVTEPEVSSSPSIGQSDVRLIINLTGTKGAEIKPGKCQ